MKVSILQINLLAMLFLVSTYTYAGPFGLTMGAKKGSFQGLEHVKKDLYKIKKIPKPHSHFEYYILRIGKKSGLCSIRAIGHTIKTNRYGTKLKSEFEELNELLSKKYGEGKTYDFLRSGSIWKEPEDFMTGLTKKERYLSATWEKKEGLKLQADLSSVYLNAAGLGRESGALVLSYDFSNNAQCEKEHEAIDADAL